MSLPSQSTRLSWWKYLLPHREVHKYACSCLTTMTPPANCQVCRGEHFYEEVVWYGPARRL